MATTTSKTKHPKTDTDTDSNPSDHPPSTRSTSNKTGTKTGKKASKKASTKTRGKKTTGKKATKKTAKKATKKTAKAATKKTGKKATKKTAKAATKKTAKAGSTERVTKTTSKPTVAEGAARPEGWPLRTPERVALEARDSVWAISSEKTTEQFEAVEAAAEAAEEERVEALADRDQPAPSAVRLRLAPGVYDFFREEVARPEDPEDPHAGWRKAQGRRRHELEPGLGSAVLLEWEQRLGWTLPPSYHDFLCEWRRGPVFVSEDGGVELLGLEASLELLEGALRERITPPLIPVVDLGCDDYLVLNPSLPDSDGEYPVGWWQGGELRGEVAGSFVEALAALVERRGRGCWWV